MKAPYVLLASIVISAVAACGPSPTGMEAAPQGGTYNTSSDGGLVFGSGNRTESDTTETTTTTSTADAGGESDSEDGRGGLVFGSGN
jgi:hypothetical protein